MVNEGRMARLASMLRRRGVILPSFEIYGGVSGLVDYGPVGARIKRKVVDCWVEHWTSIPNVVEVDSPTITPEQVLVASGHVGEFNDHMSECTGCGSIFRSDHILGEYHGNPDTLSAAQLDSEIANNKVACPSCGSTDWKGASPMNLMFGTSIGAMGGSRRAYMRPETAQGMFMLYPSLFRHFRQKLPFGAVQTGKGYRNEISPRQGMIRLREFNMAEMEYFIDPEAPMEVEVSKLESNAILIPDPDGEFAGEHNITFAEALDSGIIRHPTVAWFLAMTVEFLENVGIEPSRIRFRQHAGSEMAHYASDCWDCELSGEHGWIEAVGIANRTCHDLLAHEEHSGSGQLKGWRRFDSPRSETKEILKPVGSVIGPAFKEMAGEVSQKLEEMVELPESIPFTMMLNDGTEVEIGVDMVSRRTEEVTLHGEYFTPHVIEPAFGIDRIIWHILDHSYKEIEKEGGSYTILSLNEDIVPFEVAILPLFNKDGMGALARDLARKVDAIPGIISDLDTSRSIGRRYARADEIGIPWAVTVDHTSLADGTVTIRRRDDQKQVRVSVESLLSCLTTGSVADLY
ncbi:MAG TPA: glycine--tRNA ligase [Candidatus Thalassarchaeaceae archaeon]|nr:glycine--tRNA ligase [Candidatus Thalassarchaeaceae archaeon]